MTSRLGEVYTVPSPKYSKLLSRGIGAPLPAAGAESRVLADAGGKREGDTYAIRGPDGKRMAETYGAR